MTEEQWVNLPSEQVHVTDGITTLARVGPVRIRYRMRGATLSAFRIRTVPDPGDAAYTANERTRNRNYRLIVSTAQNGGVAEGRLLKTVKLPAAGGNVYALRALYRGHEVRSSITVESRRRLYYQVMHMAGMTAHSTANLEQAVWDPAKKFYVQLLRKPAGASEIPIHQSIQIDIDDHLVIETALNDPAVFQLGPYGRFGFVLCFARYIVSSRDQTLTVSCPVSQPGRLFQRVPNGYELTLPAGTHLWYGMDDIDDAANSWLISVVGCAFTDADGTVSAITVNRDDLVVLPDHDFAHGGRRRIFLVLDDTRLPRAFFGATRGSLQLSLDLRLVDSWTNGYQWRNTVVIANRVVWEDMSAAVREYTLVHEIGHRLGMAASGTPSASMPAIAPQAPWAAAHTPDVHAQYYDQSWGGHAGGHCQNGANWDGTNWGGAPSCVMFGADGVGWVNADGSVTINQAPPQFCPLCEPQVRKADLSH